MLRKDFLSFSGASSFFTLFNLQGAHRSLRQELYCTTLSFACQELFSRFSPVFCQLRKLSFPFVRCPSSQRNFYILPHSHRAVKHFFQNFHRLFDQFQQLFVRVVCCSLFSGTFISYHKPRLLSSIFSRTFDFFLSALREKLFIRRFSRLMSEANLTIIARLP